MEKIINKLINSSIQGVDTYTHNGSTWLIFTESKQWVIELTECKTLWYNYNFFKNLFAYASLEVVQNQHLITKWVEDNVMNGSKNTSSPAQTPSYNLTEVIENGVKETKISPTHTEYGDWLDGDERLDDIIENGVKETHFNSHENKTWVDGVIKKGIKETELHKGIRPSAVDDTIKKGVKQTLPEVGRYINDVEDIIQNGVKETNYDTDNYTDDVKEVIIEGVRSPIPRQYVGEDIIYKVIDKGVKKTSHRRYLQTFNLEDTIQDGTENDYWVMDGCDTPVDEVIENGVKEVKPMDSWVNTVRIVTEVIDNGIKETHDDVYHYKGRIDGVIKNGIKETHPMENSVNSEQWFISEQIVNNHIQTGIKETKTPGIGDIVSTVQWLNENNATSYPKMIHDIIENGIKEIKPLPSQTGNKDWSEYSHGREDRTKPFNDYLNDTLEMGVKIK
jgi:hypothetical protein